MRKNKKFIDPRYFMDEKVEGGALDQLDEMAMGPEMTQAATAAAATTMDAAAEAENYETFVRLMRKLAKAVEAYGGNAAIDASAPDPPGGYVFDRYLSALFRGLMANATQEPFSVSPADLGIMMTPGDPKTVKFVNDATGPGDNETVWNARRDVQAALDGLAREARASIRNGTSYKGTAYFNHDDVAWVEKMIKNFERGA